MTLLEVTDLSVMHGGLLALHDVNLRVEAGQIVGLIGPNGAGKTTFIDTLTGFTPAHRGSVMFNGRDLTRVAPHVRSRAGLVRTFQSLELFEDLSVRDNLLVATRTPSVWSAVTEVLWSKSKDTTETHRILELLDLLPFADRLPTEFSNGQRHAVAIGRAIVSAPKLLLLDEPAAGLDPGETRVLAELLRRLPEIGTSLLIIDHDMSLIFDLCDVVNVLDRGQLIASGSGAEVRANSAVVEAYLGTPTHDGDGRC